MSRHRENERDSDSSTSLDALDRLGVPGRIRTPDLLIRSQTLCPAELRARPAVT